MHGGLNSIVVLLNGKGSFPRCQKKQQIGEKVSPAMQDYYYVV